MLIFIFLGEGQIEMLSRSTTLIDWVNHFILITLDID